MQVQVHDVNVPYTCRREARALTRARSLSVTIGGCELARARQPRVTTDGRPALNGPESHAEARKCLPACSPHVRPLLGAYGASLEFRLTLDVISGEHNIANLPYLSRYHPAVHVLRKVSYIYELGRVGLADEERRNGQVKFID